MSRAPQALANYASLIRQIAFNRQAQPSRNIAVIPPTIRRIAEDAEATPQFAAAAAALFPGKNSPNYHASEILRRSGFYNAILDGAGGTPSWNVISRRIIPHKVKITTMLLLDLCWFPQRQFRIAGYDAKRHSRDQIRHLGPGYVVTEAFYKRDLLDPEWFSQQWFLEKSRTRVEKPGWLTAEWPRDIALDDHWQPLLILGLYSPVCLQIPVIADNHKNWELAVRKFSHPQVDIVGEDQDEVPYYLYKVTDGEWSVFQKFCGLMESGLATCHVWPRIRIAARRFLRATFLSHYDGEAWAGDDADDVLLQYVFALEALVNTGDREAISEKIAVRAALLTGRDDEERLEMRKVVKAAYSDRSRLAHGASGGEADLPRLRDVSRRAIAVAIGIAATCGSEKKFTELVEQVLVSHSIQNKLQARGRRIQTLMKGRE